MSIMVESSLVVRRPLTNGEIVSLLARINSAKSLDELLTVTVSGIFDALSAGRDQPRAGDHWVRRNPSRFAIPRSQWESLMSAIGHRADEWGSGAQAAVDMANLMPSCYDDPATPATIPPQPDYRPAEFEIRINRTAADEIAACEAYLDELAKFYGRGSHRHLEAQQTWHRCLALLFSTHLGPRIAVHRDGRLSLKMVTSSSYIGIIFRGQHRKCILPGCQAVGSDDGIWFPAYPDAAIHAHDHRPSFPFGAPQPGTWSLHS